MKKKLLLILLLSAAILLIGCLQRAEQLQTCKANADCNAGFACKQDRLCTESKPKKCFNVSYCEKEAQTGLEECSELSGQIEKEINNVQQCSSDSDCEYNQGFPSCLLTCDLAQNKNAGLAKLLSLTAEYDSNCATGCKDQKCVYKEQLDAKCVNYKCQLIPKTILEGFKVCPIGSEFGCMGITQGEYTGQPAPIVCGCIPRQCLPGEQVVASGAQGTWPDGSSKGMFECTRDVPS